MKVPSLFRSPAPTEQHLPAQAVETAAAVSPNQRIDNSEATTLRLSDDIGQMAEHIGEMADRIGQMADRIGVMADRILATQRIQSENMEASQESIRDTLRLMAEIVESNQQTMQLVLRKTLDLDPTD